MNNLFKIFFAVLLCTALSLPVYSAPEDEAPGGDTAAESSAGGDETAGSGEQETEQGQQQEQGSGSTIIDAARDALSQTEEDASAEKNLEEVFEAAERNYSLLERGGMAVSYSLGYSFFRDDRIDISLDNEGNINRFRIENDATHSLSSSLSFDYGFRDNLTMSTGLPFLIKIDTQKNTNTISLGDISFGLRWQPFPVTRGAINTTLFGNFSTATGDSPYDIDLNEESATGKGFYSFSGGLSASKVMDPVVLFASTSMSLALDATDLNQRRGGRVLEEVRPGDGVSFSMGMAYGLSYDISLSASYQQSYNFQTDFYFSDGSVVRSEDSTSASVGMSVGIRTSPERIVNLNFGFGLTEDSPDVTLGLSMPIDISGLRSEI